MQAFMDMLSGYWNEPQVVTNIVVLLNILGSMVLGLMVGYERSYRGRAAGMRTYAFVCMASCALTVITGYPDTWFGRHIAMEQTDPGRVIQGIVTGIGFLGAGVIMRDGLNISGLTTAASIWGVAVIGVLVGVGFYAAAIALSLLSTFFMVWGARLEDLLPSRHAIAVSVLFKPGIMPTEEKLLETAHSLGFEIAKGSYVISQRDDRAEWRFVAVSMGRDKSSTLIDISHHLAAIEEIDNFQVLHARN
jgi:putative Mg2+ transporter-C (MgtC) family protein